MKANGDGETTAAVVRWALLAGGVVVLLVAIGWWGKPEDEWDRIRRTGLIRVGYAIEPPYAFVTPGGGVGGESPEIAQAVIAGMGVAQIEWRLADFGLLVEMLEAHEIDVIAAGLFITPERQARVAFSPATSVVGAGLLVQAGNPHRLHSYGDLRAAENLRVAVIAGSVEERLLRGLGLSDTRLLVVADAASGQAAVAHGTAAGLALSHPTVHWLADHDRARKTEAVEDFAAAPLAAEVGGGKMAYAFRREDRRLLSAWVRAQNAFMRTDRAAALSRRHGFTPMEPPP